jgi:hypothetical protein
MCQKRKKIKNKMLFDHVYLSYLTGHEGLAAGIVYMSTFGGCFRLLMVLVSLVHIWWRSPDFYVTALHGLVNGCRWMMENAGPIQVEFYHQSLMQYTLRRLVGKMGLENGLERMLVGGVVHVALQKLVSVEWQPNFYGLMTSVALLAIEKGKIKLIVTYWLYLVAVCIKQRSVTLDYVLWCVFIPIIYVYSRLSTRLRPDPPHATSRQPRPGSSLRASGHGRPIVSSYRENNSTPGS